VAHIQINAANYTAIIKPNKIRYFDMGLQNTKNIPKLYALTDAVMNSRKFQSVFLLQRLLVALQEYTVKTFCPSYLGV